MVPTNKQINKHYLSRYLSSYPGDYSHSFRKKTLSPSGETGKKKKQKNIDKSNELRPSGTWSFLFEFFSGKLL